MLSIYNANKKIQIKINVCCSLKIVHPSNLYNIFKCSVNLVLTRDQSNRLERSKSFILLLKNVECNMLLCLSFYLLTFPNCYIHLHDILQE